jgi:SAM-dependent methyltransferase
VAAGRRRGEHPDVVRAELRPVDLKRGRVLQVVTGDGRQATTRNAPYAEAADVVDALLAEPFGNWHVETTDETVQLRVTKKGAPLVHRTAASRRDVQARSHDRAKNRLIAPSVARVPNLERLGRPLRVVDLGCGNAYLTFAAHRYLRGLAGDVRTVGVDVRPDMVERNTRLAEKLKMTGLTFETGTIAESSPFAADGPPDVVLALHACDTATDEALARAVRWGAPVVLAAPCCHHDLQRQIAEGPGAPEPYVALARHGILRERFADVLTDTLRALVLRLVGYKVDVVEFVDSRHTPRNAMVRAVRTGTGARREVGVQYRALTADWGVHPALARMLDDEVARALGR